MKKIFAQTLFKLAKDNPSIFLITADLGFGVLGDFADFLPKQFLNVGVAEQNMMGIATGLALEGKIVFTYSIANFPTLRCLEQIRNDACYHNANVKIVSIGAGFSYGAAGISHHATEDLAIMRVLPMTLLAPGSFWEVEQAVLALVKQPGACYLRLDNSYAEDLNKNGDSFLIGKARRVVDGDDLTIVAIGGVLGVAIKAAVKLLEEGIKCRVVSMHTLNPLDKHEIFAAAKNTGGIITVEEHRVQGGLGGVVAEVCLESGVIPHFFYRIGLREDFSSKVGNQDYLRGYYNISERHIIQKARELLLK
ncbi:MAG: hypothetical protein A2X78_02955 [Gammaproteobacteria bacterium GWE2_37_16]|nr:MAG: hypothetical protein A2X78_02955 [Gammaproteobacteria bacterium GWE2_37_16]